MIFDFYEMLGRGIIAARTNRSEEARQYLELAARMEPENPRVWLWMAAVSDSLPEKRRYLEKSLSLEPGQPTTRALLERMERGSTQVEQAPSDFAVFTCPNCGGSQRFDPDRAGLVCDFCKEVEALDLESPSATGPAELAALLGHAGNWSFTDSQFSCSACGAQISMVAGRLTSRCPFCDSQSITLQPATRGLIQPSGIVLFRYHMDDIFGIVTSYWRVRREEIDPLLDNRQLVVSAIYLPFWIFAGWVQIRCALDYPAPLATYSPTERVFDKDSPVLGRRWYECRLDDVAIYGGGSIPERAIGLIPAYDLQGISAYLPQLLTGWQAEFYQVALEDAAVVAHKRMRDLAFAKAVRRGLAMDSSRMFSDDVMVLDQTYQLALLPVWIVRRFLAGKEYVTLINGQTGQVARPQKSWLKKLKSMVSGSND